MPVPKEMVLRLAELARIELPPLELDNLASDLTKITEYYDCLSGVDNDLVNNQNFYHRGNNVFYEDVIITSISVDEALKNVPRTKDNYFVVPRVIE